MSKHSVVVVIADLFWLTLLVFADRMRLQLLAAWTNALKTIGKRLIVLMLLVFKPHYEDEEVRAACT